MSPEMATEATLGTLEALYDAYHRQALGLAYRLVHNQADAEEVVQDAFLSVWRAWDSYDASKGSVRTWLFTVVRNRAIDKIRAAQRASTDPLPEGLDPADSTDVFAEAAATIEGEQARQAVVALPAEQRQVIELAYFGGLSHGEIAERLATPVGTVKSRIRLAMERLRAAMNAPPRTAGAVSAC